MKETKLRDSSHLGAVLIAAIVHHGHCALLPVFDAGHFFRVKEAGLVPVELTKTQETIEEVSSVERTEELGEDH